LPATTSGPHRAALYGALRAIGLPMAALLLMQLAVGVVLSPQGTFLPLFITGQGYPVLFISALSAGQRALGLLGAWLGGGLVDSWGAKRALVLGLIGAVLSSLAFASPGPGWFVPLLLAGSLCGGVQTVGAQSTLLAVAPPTYLGVYSAGYNWGLTLGGALGNPLAGALLAHGGYALFGLVMALLALGALLAGMWLLPAAPGGTGRGRAPGVTRRLFGYGDVAARPAAWTLAFLRFLPTCYYGLSSILIPLFLHDAGAAMGVIALYATLSQVLASVAQMVVGRAVDHLGPKEVTVATFSVLVVSILGLGVAPGRLWCLWTFGCLSTAAAWSLSTLMPSLVARVTEPAARGRVLGWVHLWWNLGVIVGAIGVALLPWGRGVPFLAAGVLNIAALVLAFTFFRTGEHSPLPG
jgi:MFS family permease